MSISKYPTGFRDTLRWYERAQRDPWFLKEMPISLAVMRESGLYPPRMKITEKNYAPLCRHIADIEERRLAVIGGRPIWLEPPASPPRVIRLASVWTLYCRCLFCDGNKFLPVQMNGADPILAACYTCLPPSQYPALGAKPVAYSMIAQATEHL